MKFTLRFLNYNHIKVFSNTFISLTMNFSFSMQNRTTTRDSKTNIVRMMSSMQTQLPGSLYDSDQIDPYRLLEDDLKDIYDDIREVSEDLSEMNNL